MVAQFCPFCAQPITVPNAMFCASCGRSFPWIDSASAPMPTPVAPQNPYGYVPPTPLYAGAQPTPQPAPPSTVAGYTPVYVMPAPAVALAPHPMQGAPMRQPGATSPGRLVGVAIGFGLLALILGGLADVSLVYSGAFIAESFFDTRPFAAELYSFFGWEVCGLLYLLGLMRSVTKSPGRVLSEILAVLSAHWMLLVFFPLVLLAVLRHGFIPVRIILIYGVLSGCALLVLGFFCYGFVAFAGTWRLARQQSGIHGLSAGAYLVIFGGAYAPLIVLYLLIYPLLGDNIRLLHYSFLLLSALELVAFIILGSVMAWRRVKQAPAAPASVP